MMGPVPELLRAELLERAFCVGRPSLERYLATEASPPAVEPILPPALDSNSDDAVSQRRKNEPSEHRERWWREDELLRSRGCRRYSQPSRGWRFWDHD